MVTEISPGSGTPRQPSHTISIAKIGLVEIAAALSKRADGQARFPWKEVRALFARFLRRPPRNIIA